MSHLIRVEVEPNGVLPEDLRAIAKESARLQIALPQWSENDLYGEHGMPG